jgi:deoxyribodipyrimidine photo-lyase
MKVDQRRVRSLNSEPLVPAGPVVYVMAREQRVEDNWALLYAKEVADDRGVPLSVLFTLAPMFNHGSARHNEWMVASLQAVATKLASYDIPFYIEMGEWADTVTAFVARTKATAVVFDFNPLEPVASWRHAAAKKLSVPAYEVDARNIVPTWIASPKAEFAAYTFRPKVTRLLSEFLTPFPKLVSPKVAFTGKVPKIDWEVVRAFRQCDYKAVVPTTFVPGEEAGEQMLKDFIKHRLDGYATKRNDPTSAGVSDLSPYLRWGNISSQRVALTVKTTDAPPADREAFLEELIVRRELSDNYCLYTKDYTKVSSAHAWAQTTIAEHAKDARDHIYTYKEFEAGQTHDPLWNAAQNQMVETGKMHGFMRMYWAKKILEWTPDVQTAIDTALKLNDHYSLDGRDSNGVCGVLWAIVGLHDRAWNERPVFGKIRYMNYAGCKRKFPVKVYEARYGGATHESSLF